MSKDRGQRVRELVAQMRALTASVARRNRRIARLQAWERYEVAKREAEGAPTLSAAADRRRAALREAQRADCAAGYHEDPDHSGMCIRCGAGT